MQPSSSDIKDVQYVPQFPAGFPGATPGLPSTEIKAMSEEQAEQMATLLEILKYSQVALDKSPTGGGKTYHASYVVQKTPGAKALVLCPAKTIPVWQKVFREYNIPNHGVYSMEANRPATNKFNTDLVKTVEWTTVTERKVEKQRPAEAEPTYTFMNYLEAAPTVLIVDEYHRAKNEDTGTVVLVRALIAAIRRHNAAIRAQTRKGYAAKVIMSSATPYDKMEHALGFLRTIGIISDKNLAVYDESGQLVSTAGYDQLIRYCDAVLATPFLAARVSQPNKEWYAFFKQDPRNHPKAGFQFDDQNIAYEISTRIVEPAISARTRIQGLTDGLNAFYNAPPEQSIKIADAVRELASISGFRPDGTVGQGGNMGRITEALGAVEMSKIGIFARVAYDVLRASPNNKVIIMTKFRDQPIAALEYYFKNIPKEYGGPIPPIILTGEVPLKKREEIISQFQAPNNNHRLLIATVQTGGESISLHDTDGRFPRWLLISPTFSAIEGLQAAGRVDRRGVKSTPHVRFVYARVPVPEARILAAVAVKYGVLGEHKAGVESSDIQENKLPSDYPAMIEGILDDKGRPREMTVDQALAVIQAETKMSTAEALGMLSSMAPVQPVGYTSSRTSARGRGRRAPAKRAPSSARGGQNAGAAGANAGGGLVPNFAQIQQQFAQQPQQPQQFMQQQATSGVDQLTQMFPGMQISQPQQFQQPQQQYQQPQQQQFLQYQQPQQFAQQQAPQAQTLQYQQPQQTLQYQQPQQFMQQQAPQAQTLQYQQPPQFAQQQPQQAPQAQTLQYQQPQQPQQFMQQAQTLQQAPPTPRALLPSQSQMPQAPPTPRALVAQQSVAQQSVAQQPGIQILPVPSQTQQVQQVAQVPMQTQIYGTGGPITESAQSGAAMVQNL